MKTGRMISHPKNFYYCEANKQTSQQSMINCRRSHQGFRYQIWCLWNKRLMLHKVKEVMCAEHNEGILYHIFCWNVSRMTRWFTWYPFSHGKKTALFSCLKENRHDLTQALYCSWTKVPVRCCGNHMILLCKCSFTLWSYLYLELRLLKKFKKSMCLNLKAESLRNVRIFFLT